MATYTDTLVLHMIHPTQIWRSGPNTPHTHTLTHNGEPKYAEMRNSWSWNMTDEMKLECLSCNFHSSVWAMIALFTSSQIFRLPLSTCTLFTLSEAAVLQMHSVVWTEMTLTMWMERPDWDASDVFETASTWAKHQPCFNLLPGGFERFWK